MGVVDSVDELFEQEYARMVRSLGVAFDPESAADAVQEAFVEADRRWRKIGGYLDPAAWVRRVAINRLRNGRRNQRRRREILATIRPVADDDLSADLLDLRRALAALPEQQRLAVCLHYLGGLPVAEVADALDVAEGTVKSNLHDARANLRIALEVPDG
ncbi:MAG: sigma-70 family RNA polymerase sigma factor [Acidimicrobiia bacterium]|nr:sigma-70 family RNA polymerase sigma factor [Acidimicrobiia bacterium]